MTKSMCVRSEMVQMGHEFSPKKSKEKKARNIQQPGLSLQYEMKSPEK